MRRFNTFEKIVLTILVSVGFAGAAFAIAFTALAIGAEIIYHHHPGSMTGFWAFMNALIAAGAGLAGGIAWAVIRVWRNDRGHV